MGVLRVNLKIDGVLYTAEDNYTNNNIVYNMEISWDDGGQTTVRDYLYSSPRVYEDNAPFGYTVHISSLTDYADVTKYDDAEHQWFAGNIGVNGEIVVTLELKSKYVITYDANGGTYAPPQQGKLFDMPTELYPRMQGYIPIRDGYYFKEWNTKSDGSGVSYLPSEVYLDNSSITLYAQWVPSDRIYINQQGFVSAVPYVYTDGRWRLAVRHIYTPNSGW